MCCRQPEYLVSCLTVLIVEDEPAILTMSRLILERAGYKVLATEAGPEAVARFRAEADRICVVVLDINLPGMNGWDVLTEVRRLRPEVRVVMTSGSAHDELTQPEYSEVPTAVLPKPFRPVELVEVVARVLSGPY
jgi:two-component system cell cycle sensor histidine kinase/response regulator CckA